MPRPQPAVDATASTPPATNSPASAAVISTRRRWRRLRRVCAVVCLLLLAVFHVPILQGIGSLLIVNGTPASPGAVVLMSGDGQYTAAARAFQSNPELVILKPEFTKTRLEELGIWPDRVAEFHRELTRRGIPDEQQVVLRGPARNEWEAMELLNEWLARDNPAQIAALCDEFQTRRLQWVVSSVLQSRASQVGIQPLADRRYDSTNWWKSRAGIRTVILAGISLATSAFHRTQPLPPPRWNPDDYEQQLRALPKVEPPAERSGRWLAALAHWLDIGQTPERVDHVVLLPGDENVRPFVAAALVKAGLARDILLPQNYPSPAIEDGIVPPNHEVTAMVVERRGLPPGTLRILDMKSDGTIHDAQATREVLDHEPEARVAIVTSFYHTRRARMSFRAVYGARADSFVYVSAPVTDITADNWWDSDAGTQMIVTEFVKCGIYWVGYGPGKYWLVGLGLGGVVLWRWRRHRRRARRRAVDRALIAA